MKTIRVLVALAAGVSLLIAAACSGPNEPGHPQFRFPLSVGNQWTYDEVWIWKYHDGRADDTMYFNPKLNLSIESRDTLPNGVIVHNFRYEFVAFPFEPVIGFGEYVENAKGFHYRSSDPIGSTLPKTVTRFGQPYTLSEALQIGTLPPTVLLPIQADLSNEVFDPPLLLLPYPQRVGQQWVFREDVLDGAGPIRRRISSLDSVRTSAGDFECYEVQSLYPEDFPDVELRDYFSDVGLVRRLTVSHDMVLTSYDGSTEGDTVDVTIITDLASFDLK